MTTADLSTARWKRLSKRIIERDGHICQIKGPRCTTTADCTDHIIARELGGAVWDERNLRAACTPCNSGRRLRYQPIDVQTPQPSRAW